jgi:hypothetical protein
MNQAKGNFAVLNLKSDFDGVKFSDMDKIYYRRINNIAQDKPVLVVKSDKKVKEVWW